MKRQYVITFPWLNVPLVYFLINVRVFEAVASNFIQNIFIYMYISVINPAFRLFS